MIHMGYNMNLFQNKVSVCVHLYTKKHTDTHTSIAFGDNVGKAVNRSQMLGRTVSTVKETPTAEKDIWLFLGQTLYSI